MRIVIFMRGYSKFALLLVPWERKNWEGEGGAVTCADVLSAARFATHIQEAQAAETVEEPPAESLLLSDFPLLLDVYRLLWGLVVITRLMVVWVLSVHLYCLLGLSPVCFCLECAVYIYIYIYGGGKLYTFNSTYSHISS